MSLPRELTNRLVELVEDLELVEEGKTTVCINDSSFSAVSWSAIPHLRALVTRHGWQLQAVSEFRGRLVHNAERICRVTFYDPETDESLDTMKVDRDLPLTFLTAVIAVLEHIHESQLHAG